MEVKHLTEEDLQNYLNRSSEVKTKDIDKHLEMCQSCRENLRFYQTLYSGLTKVQDIKLSEGFNEKVMRALPHHYPLKAKIGFLNIFVAIIGIVVCFAITQHYVNLKPVGKETVNSLLPSIDFQAPSILSGETFSITFWAKYKILLFALVVLLLVLMVDQLWRKRTYWGRASKVIMI